MKKIYRNVSGILLLDKPLGLSSNQALQKARHLFEAAKAGHTGSLDPLATGLLPICFGEATKIAGYLLGASKAYRAELRLGVTTSTDDAEGEQLVVRPVPELSAADIEAALDTLRGRITQVPPVYSAIKQGGVALYKRARRGEDVRVPARQVDVQRLDLLDHDGDRMILQVECGSGTYVRSLARDLGERFGCGAHLTALRRLWVEPFRQATMYALQELEQIKSRGGTLDGCLLPLEHGLAGLPELQLSDDQAAQLKQGKRLQQTLLCDAALCRASGPDGRLIALVRTDGAGEVSVLRGFNI
jgi:tRNA pseudouridine55 synthase